MHPVSPLLDRIPLAVLAGGHGTRMRRAKGLLRIGGTPILQYLLDRVDWPGAKWLVTAPGRENPPGFERFDHELVDAGIELGPLGGVLTALDALGRGTLVVVTVDMPGIRRLHLQWLAGQLDCRPDHLGVMCRRQIAGREQIEPFPLAIRARARPLIEERMRTGRRAAHELLNDPGFVAIDAPVEWGDGAWTNLNRPEDVAEFERRQGID